MPYKCAKFERNRSVGMVSLVGSKLLCKTVRRRKWDNFQEHISHKLQGRFLSNLVCRVAYIQGIKYVNLIEIGLVVIEIWGVENDELAVLVNNTLVRHTAFLAPDKRPCVLILPIMLALCLVLSLIDPLCSKLCWHNWRVPKNDSA